MHSDSYHPIVVTILIIFISINLLILDWYVFILHPNTSVSISSSANPPTTGVSPVLPNESCPSGCLSLIQTATPSASTPSPTYIPPKTSTNVILPREYYIPLGTGSTQKQDWDPQMTTDTLIDTGNYPHIKETYFIVSLTNPTQNGQIEAELYNVTDNHPVWYSDLALYGSKTQTLTSAKIILDNGPKLYRVRLKSSLGYQGSLDYAKIRIVTQ